MRECGYEVAGASDLTRGGLRCCRGSSHIQPKTSVKDFDLALISMGNQARCLASRQIGKHNSAMNGRIIAECNQFCHPVQRYAATKCKVMLPSSATECCHLRRSPKSVQNFIHAEGVRCRGCGWVRTMSGSSSGSKVRFADQLPITPQAFLLRAQCVRCPVSNS